MHRAHRFNQWGSGGTEGQAIGADVAVAVDAANAGARMGAAQGREEVGAIRWRRRASGREARDEKERMA